MTNIGIIHFPEAGARQTHAEIVLDNIFIDYFKMTLYITVTFISVSSERHRGHTRIPPAIVDPQANELSFWILTSCLHAHPTPTLACLINPEL